MIKIYVFIRTFFFTVKIMKKFAIFLFLTILAVSMTACDGIGTPIDTGVDSDGIDAGIEWMYPLDAYPTYGVDRQRQKHYYTYDVTTEQIDEYIGALLDAGYTVADSYGTALASGSRHPVGTYAGAEAYYVMSKTDGTTVILTYIYQENGTWISEVDS